MLIDIMGKIKHEGNAAYLKNVISVLYVAFL